MLINANQAVVGKALYDPFGNFLALSGSIVLVNPFWYSSKPIHWASGKYDFLYRWYYPILQRWPNRDPLGEPGFEILRRPNAYGMMRFLGGIAERAEGPDLYEFVANDPIKLFDSLGLDMNNPVCQSLQTQFDFILGLAARFLASGDEEGWAEMQGILLNIDAEMSAAGCFDPPPPPPPPDTCPAPSPAPPSRGFNPPRGFWPIVGIGVGIGVGAVICTLCPECCAVGVLAGA